MKRASAILFVSLIINIITKGQIVLKPFISGLSFVTDIGHAGDERIFIIEQAGRIRISDLNGNVNASPFLDIANRVASGGEMGLLGMAFSPDYSNNRTFYVNYTTTVPGSLMTRVSRFRASAVNPDSASAAIEEILLQFSQPYQNHNGGAIQFGPDGYLYVATGDGGAANDPQNYGQNLLTMLGKILRIDVSADSGYTVPPSNPYANDAVKNPHIWSYGLRNPWRISFDRLVGDLWMGDVGQGSWEEIDFQPAASQGGENYGWRCYEGNSVFFITGCDTAAPYVFPVYQYPHSGANSGCSVTGGYVYRGAQFNDLFGKYFFTDFCSDDIYSIRRDSAGAWKTTLELAYSGQGFGTFGEDVYGELYVAGNSSGNIFKIESNGCKPVAFITLEDTLEACGGEVLLKAWYSPGLKYQWKKDGAPIAGAVSSSYLAGKAGYYTVMVSNDSCSGESAPVFVDKCLPQTSGVLIAPNPAISEINLVIQAPQAGMGELRIYDLAGKLCLQAQLNLNAPYRDNYRVGIPTLASGAYALKLTAPGIDFSGKVVIAKPEK